MSLRPHSPMQHLAPVDVATLAEYPLDADTRLTTHYFMAWHHDRWLNSRFRLSAPPDVRGLAVDLFCLSQKQTPVGTLPDDDVQLAALTLLSLQAWLDYRRREWSPLYHWEPCLCGGEVRLMHSVVTEMIIDSMALRDKRRVEGDLGRKRKRLERLPQQVQDAGGTRGMASDSDLLDRLDCWLVQHCKGNRTREWVRRAMENDAVIGVGVT